MDIAKKIILALSTPYTEIFVDIDMAYSGFAMPSLPVMQVILFQPVREYTIRISRFQRDTAVVVFVIFKLYQCSVYLVV